MLSQLPFECPQHLLTLAGQGEPTPMAVAGAESSVALESVKAAHDEGLILPYLVGDPASIKKIAAEIQWPLGDFEIVSADGEEDTAAKAVELVRKKQAKALMKGQIHTDRLMRAVIDREKGLRTGRRLSHIFYMTAPGREGALSITDAAVNVAPSVDVRMDILRNAISFQHALGQACPKVAVISATETPNPAMPTSMEAADIVARAGNGEIEGALVEGPFALDLAVSPHSVKIKGIASKVAGQADVLLMPAIEAGNVLFKAMVYYMSACAAGLVLGAAAPIVLTSRADPPEARLAAAALASIVSQSLES
ncbi:MAG: bifunctional enoyl-CoA hydratase/phosphate acetyltransferase [Pseudomonadota bacterium]